MLFVHVQFIVVYRKYVANAINRHAASIPNDNELSITTGLGRELGQEPAINLSHAFF